MSSEEVGFADAPNPIDGTSSAAAVTDVTDTEDVTDTSDLAWFTSDGHIYWTRGLASPPYTALGSSVIRLIQATYDHHPHNARRLLRNRIFTSRKLSELDRATVRIAAKRVQAVPKRDTSGLSALFNRSPSTELVPLALPESPCSPPGEPVEILRQLGVHSLARADVNSPEKTQRYLKNRALGAIAVGPDGRQIGFELNRSLTNKVFHAEMLLALRLTALQQATGEGLPAGTTITCSLKPCRMCAAAMLEISHGSINIIYLENDPGPAARHQLLDGIQTQWPGAVV